MLTELLEYDQQGIVPSRNEMSIDDTLKEAERKKNILELIRTDPSKFLYQFNGVDVDAESIEHPRTAEQLKAIPVENLADAHHYLANLFFEDTRMTDVHPAIIVHDKDFGKATGMGFIGRQREFSLKFARGVSLKTKGPIEMGYMLLKDDGRQSFQMLNNMRHETIHTLRWQWKGRLNRFVYSYSEEIMATKAAQEVQDSWHNRSMSIEYATTIYGYPLALILGAGFVMFGLSGVVPLGTGAAAATTPSVVGYAKTHKFESKCKTEGIDPYYLFMRSNPHSYSRKKTIAQSLKEKDGLRFQIMRERLGI